MGVDGHSDFPPGVLSRLPRLGPDLEIDIDAVAALDPDLVLATLTVPGHETVIEGLELAGLPFLAPQPESLTDVYEDIRLIAERLGVPERGDALVEEMRAAFSAGSGAERADTATTPQGTSKARPNLGTVQGGPRILVQWWPKPTIAPGRRSWTHDVIVASGAQNVLGDADLQSRPLTDEEVLELDPDVIVISWCGVDPSQYRPDVVLDKPSWRTIGAVQRGQVHCVPEAFLGRPGPRLVDGLHALRRIVETART